MKTMHNLKTGLFKLMAVVTVAFGLIIIFATSPVTAAETLPTDAECSKLENMDSITAGWCAAIDRRRGNCLACHSMVVNPWPEGLPPGGNIAPPMVAMKQRFPDREKLRQQIYDATVANPISSMPPFGKHGLLTGEEIESVIDFLMTI